MLLQDKRGFSLTELIVVMAIFLVVILITSNAFNTIINQSTQQAKSVETQIEGIVGLEVLRADLEQAGFGLPWVLQSTSPGPPATTYTVAYAEAVGDATLPAAFWPSGIDSSSFNDAPSAPPRAVLSGDTTFNKDGANVGSKYLVIKSTLAAANDTSKKWTTVAYANGGKTVKSWGITDRDFSSAERVTVVKNVMASTQLNLQTVVPVPTRQLMASDGATFAATFGTYSTLLSNIHLDGDTYEVYGVNPNTALRMPFNRADYYVMRPGKMPKTCSDSTGVGILYKSTVIHNTGTSSAGGLTAGMPLLDCVADMQVVYGLDTSGTGAGVVNVHTTAPLASATVIRDQLREIRVYVLAQEGQRDRFYSYPSETILVGESFGGTVQGRLFNLKDRLGPDYKYYRWKVYTIVVRPKNLIQ
jgi:prepilin-type N-terminal cleavage/methylation domain-containing protein